jgi:DNA polymerase-3 subunit epsilon
MPKQPPPTDYEILATQLEASDNHRVLRRLVPRQHYADLTGRSARRAVVIDVETTGLDVRTNAIIQLAAVAFSYDPDSGSIGDVDEPLSFLEDPGTAIPSEITALTGITQDMVRGKKIDEAAVATLVTGAPLIIAHNASFDRPFVERRLPGLKGKPWACSLKEVPWKAEGSNSKALDYLLFKHCRLFFDWHRAPDDALALIHVLATAFPNGELPLRLLLESARRKTVRIWAVGAPIETKDLLKSRGYRWNPVEEDGRPRAWNIEIPETLREAEESWLTASVYTGRPNKARVDLLDARTRYAL